MNGQTVAMTLAEIARRADSGDAYCNSLLQAIPRIAGGNGNGSSSCNDDTATGGKSVIFQPGNSSLEAKVRQWKRVIEENLGKRILIHAQPEARKHCEELARKYKGMVVDNNHAQSMDAELQACKGPVFLMVVK